MEGTGETAPFLNAFHTLLLSAYVKFIQYILFSKKHKKDRSTHATVSFFIQMQATRGYYFNYSFCYFVPFEYQRSNFIAHKH